MYFQDPSQPITVIGLDQHPVQLATRAFAVKLLSRTLSETEDSLSDSEVKNWLQKNVEPYPIKAIWQGKLSSTLTNSYLVSDLIEAIKKTPARPDVPLVDDIGRTTIKILGQEIGAVELSAHAQANKVHLGTLKALATREGIKAIPGFEVRIKGNNSLRMVFAETQIDPLMMSVLSGNGVSLPTPSGYRIACTLAQWKATKYPNQQGGLYHLVEGKLIEKGIGSVVLQELTQVTSTRPLVRGNSLILANLKALEGSPAQEHTVLHDLVGGIKVYNSSLTDIQDLYWIYLLEANLK